MREASNLNPAPQFFPAVHINKGIDNHFKGYSMQGVVRLSVVHEAFSVFSRRAVLGGAYYLMSGLQVRHYYFHCTFFLLQAFLDHPLGLIEFDNPAILGFLRKKKSEMQSML